MTEKQIHTVVVDDDKHYLFLHEFLIKKSNLCQDPVSLISGELAKDYLKKNYQTDQQFLIFLDIYMPNLDGWAVLDFIESSFKTLNIKVILVSSSVNKDDKAKSKEYASVIDYVEKPLLMSHLKDLQKQLF
ncbi:MAG: two component signal transduction system response regulator [Algoriphagus marincola HL-49]|uniref:Two component signal transduction system response regulator n=1 Tax=Algoriphagus marincola HL-49 TaxID=1305737 RepID=A0A0P7XQ53_9BACT|nr:MAG: two component signal transduction system response regulator [Algoriphagus marincola HL-49]